ncbi:MAG: hypothetical protein ACYDBQ_12010 [Thermoplasmatota archaeon]
MPLARVPLSPFGTPPWRRLALPALGVLAALLLVLSSLIGKLGDPRAPDGVGRFWVSPLLAPLAGVLLVGWGSQPWMKAAGAALTVLAAYGGLAPLWMPWFQLAAVVAWYAVGASPETRAVLYPVHVAVLLDLSWHLPGVASLDLQFIAVAGVSALAWCALPPASPWRNLPYWGLLLLVAAACAGSLYVAVRTAARGAIDTPNWLVAAAALAGGALLVRWAAGPRAAQAHLPAFGLLRPRFARPR